MLSAEEGGSHRGDKGLRRGTPKGGGGHRKAGLEQLTTSTLGPCPHLLPEEK